MKWRVFANSWQANLERMNHNSSGKKRWNQLRRLSTTSVLEETKSGLLSISWKNVPVTLGSGWVNLFFRRIPKQSIFT